MPGFSGLLAELSCDSTASNLPWLPWSSGYPWVAGRRFLDIRSRGLRRWCHLMCVVLACLSLAGRHPSISRETSAARGLQGNISIDDSISHHSAGPGASRGARADRCRPWNRWSGRTYSTPVSHCGTRDWCWGRWRCRHLMWWHSHPMEISSPRTMARAIPTLPLSVMGAIASRLLDSLGRRATEECCRQADALGRPALLTNT